MSSKSSIEWTEFTWNPTVGCTKISAGCKNCYAENMSFRLKAMGVEAYKDGFKFKILPDRLLEPYSRKKPTMFFVNSMSDLFHEDMPFQYLDKIFDVIENTPQHVYQILTKRPQIMHNYTSLREKPIPSNAWLGVSVENQRHGVPRIEILRDISCDVRFLSIEPLLEDLGELDLRDIQWVIVGGESGPGARPMSKEWVDSIRVQCQASKVPFFFKQWGAFGPDGVKRSKKNNGRELNGQTWSELPIIVNNFSYSY